MIHPRPRFSGAVGNNVFDMPTPARFNWFAAILAMSAISAPQIPPEAPREDHPIGSGGKCIEVPAAKLTQHIGSNVQYAGALYVRGA